MKSQELENPASSRRFIMPYDNVPSDKTDAMDKCVNDVMDKEGVDKESAIAICYESIVNGARLEDVMKTFYSGITRGELVALSEPTDGKTIKIQILRVGEFEDMNGVPLNITPQDLETYVKNSNAALAKEEIAVDLGHPSDPGAPAAAWYKKFFTQVVNGISWVCAEIELSALGAQSLADKLYKYFSATLNFDSKTILGGGFVNRPAITGQQPLGSLMRFMRVRHLEMSMEELVRKISLAIEEKYSNGMDDYRLMPYPLSTYNDRVVVTKADKYYEIPYTLENDEIILGDPVEVEVTYTPKPASGGNMGKEIEQAVALAREEEKQRLAKEREEMNSRIELARREERERVLAEQKRAENIRTLAGKLTIGARAFPQKPEDLIAVFSKMSDDDLKAIEPILTKIAESGLVDLSERGHSGSGNTKELPKEYKPMLMSYLAKKAGTVKDWFEANPEVGKMEDFNLTEFSQNGGK